MSSSTKPFDIIVVGGSLGGLFAGIVFKRLGHNIRILERTPTALLHNQGAGIVAGGPTQAFFSKYDRTKTPIAVTSHTRQYLNAKGDIIDSEGSEQKMTSWDLLYNILRANFDGQAEEGYCSIPESTSTDGKAEYLNGHTVKSIQDLGSRGILVSFVGKDGKEGTIQGDILIGADGPSSTIRKLVLPDVERTYAGYVAWRGTVPEDEVSSDIHKCFAEKFTFFHREACQILTYLIPGRSGSLKPGERLINYVWYQNYKPDELDTLLTDSEGKKHHYTLPPSSVSKELFTRQKKYAESTLPRQFSALVNSTKEPFIQVVTDAYSKTRLLTSNKVILVGDAGANVRPHTAASTSEAARCSMLLGVVDIFQGVNKTGNQDGWGKEITLEEWEIEVLRGSERTYRSGVEMGKRSQFGKHPMADDRDPGVGTLN